jgi:CDP-diacylglycerol--glycerol-3-phosphate 3-phosphatidyltransferase
MNVINYREDEHTLLDLLKMFGKEGGLSKIKLATGYFNLQDEFLDVIKKNPGIKAEFLTSSPRANGFYKAGRFKKYIPGMYRVNELAVLKQTSKGGNVKIHEWESGEWTFHAKGAWIYEEGEELPQATIIGSSNYSFRSNRRDTEAQLYLVSNCDRFKKKLHEEAEHLYGKS